MLNRWFVAAGLACIAMVCHGQSAPAFDAASAFGARQDVTGVHISPDGKNVVYISPGKGQGSIAYTYNLAGGGNGKPPLSSDGQPFRLRECHWVSNDRIVCLIYAVEKDPALGVVGLTRTVGVGGEGKNLRLLSTGQNDYSLGLPFGGGSILVWLPDENGVVLMTRVYVPDDHIGSLIGKDT